jgi:hypothetical protein
MKHALTSAVFVISCVSLLAPGLIPRVQAGQCSNASIKGTYGFSCEGTAGGLPIAVIGVFTADGNGTGSEVETISFNGDISQGVLFTVTYTVNADCTGSFVSTGPDGIPFDNDFVLDDNKKEIRLMPTESGFVAVCIYRKQ